MNVIAALPLQSAEILLALYEADSIELKGGSVRFPKDSFGICKTKIEVELEDGSVEEIEYKIFINCGGHKKLEIEDYPFQSMVKQGGIHCAKARFANSNFADSGKFDAASIIKTKDAVKLKLSGIDIDSSYRTINNEGKSNPFLYDINFTHTSGLRPYSYGLQACSATSLIVVESWMAEILEGKNIGDNIENITELYEENDDL